MHAASSLLLDPLETAAPAPPAAASCYHCGLAVPPASNYRTTLGGEVRDFCCAGCEAIAEAIHGAGLERFYAQRERSGGRPEAESGTDWTVYDLPAMQTAFVRECPDGEREATLLLEGMSCPACAWLNEEHLRRQPGVREVRVNYTTQRMQLRWNAAGTRLSMLLGSVAAIGYRATPFDGLREDARRRSERRKGLLRLLVAGLGMMQVMMYAIPAYISEDGIAPEQESLLHWASLVLTLPVMLYSALPFFQGAWRDLRHRRVGMDVPVALGLLAAFLASVYATLRGGAVYFDSVTMFVFLLLLARQLEASARARAAEALEAIAKPLPRSCRRIIETPLGWREEATPVAALAPGDRVRVCAGEIFPADGEVLEGESRAEEAMLTGEFWPVRKTPGDPVYAGSINQESVLSVRVNAVGEGTRLQSISRLLERALAAKPPLARIADRIAARFVMLQLAFAALTGLIWLWVDSGEALPAVVAILVVSCPCALALATPLALAVAGGALARRGVLVTGAGALETLAKVSDVVFDKTGTLSEGQLRCVWLKPAADGDAARVREIAAALATSSRHPIARALAQEFGPGLAVDSPREYPGAGVAGRVQGENYRMGRLDWVAQWAGLALPPLPEAPAGASMVALARPGAWLAFLALADAPRQDTLETLRGLRALGLNVHLLSGDRSSAVAAFAAQVRIDETQAGARPEDKLAYVAKLQASGAAVAMVGDGVNDAPSLGQAQVSIALGEGADLAKSAADLVLIGHSPAALAFAVRKARQCRAVLRENLGWALLYNVLALPLAAAGMLTPWLAAVGMSLSSLLVVGNAARLARHDGLQ